METELNRLRRDLSRVISKICNVAFSSGKLSEYAYDVAVLRTAIDHRSSPSREWNILLIGLEVGTGILSDLSH